MAIDIKPYKNRQIYPYACGVDEAGRGPLAGDVYAAAVILDPNHPIEGLCDSKKISAKRREYLYSMIVDHALFYAVSLATVEEIDNLNILNASMLAMQRCIALLMQKLPIKTQLAEGLSTIIKPSIILVDGNKLPSLSDLPACAIVGGDNLIAEISAASILAKVSRDRAMCILDAEYPQYQFAKHKGYGTKLHLEIIAKEGILPNIHRVSFAPIKKIYLS